METLLRSGLFELLLDSYFLLLVIAIAPLVIYLFKRWLFTRYSNLPPGPSGLPVIGSLHRFGELAHQNLAKMATEYGPLIDGLEDLCVSNFLAPIDPVAAEGSVDLELQHVGAATWRSSEYDVFINHRGPDVKKTFVAHLYAALSSYGIRPFLDAEDIGYGQPVLGEIDKALRGACVHVAIFSKRYAESIYCLEELCAMLESKGWIIPVFYNVEAGDLRRPEDGPYKEAFEKHRKRGRTEKIPIWKEALFKVADYRALRMDEVNGNEHELIRRIVVEVRNALPRDLLPGRRIGLEESMKDVVKTLESVRVIGLVGMGGIGKTTLAMEVYNHFVSCQRFDRYCFVKDVRSSQTSVLQNNVLRDLGNADKSHCNDERDYTRKLRVALKDQNVLVIVDDISDSNQFKALVPEINELGWKSRIVMTSRARDVLKDAMKTLPASSKAVYEVKTLDKSYSQRLFNIHAFGSETPSKGFVELAETISDACDGLPLALTVMGSYLFEEKDKEIWVESVKVLQGNTEIIDQLRICYDGLPTDGDRKMFRDIACMVIGVKQEVAMIIWKSCSNCSCSCLQTPVSSLRNLIDRSLVKLDKDDTLRMHDVLRDMGRKIVETDGKKEGRQPAKEWTHLWDPAIAEEELRRGKVNTKTRGICLTVDDPDENFNFQEPSLSCEASKLGRMQELHLLRLDGCNLVHDDFSSWSQQLRWLQWRCSRLTSFPPQLKLPHLAVLDLKYSLHLQCLWEKNVHVMVKLAHLVVLDLRYCLELTCLWENDANIQLLWLEVLRLTFCYKLVGLPNNFGVSAPKLKRLEMWECRNLKTLPNSIGLLTELEHLDLFNCRELISLPNTFGGLVGLETLVLTSCLKLEEMPMESGRLVNPEEPDVGLKKLKKLEMLGTRGWPLPTEFGLLTSLTSLSMDVPTDSVPAGFDRLKALTHLSVWGGKDVSMRLSDSLGAFTALQSLHMELVEKISRIPRSLGELKCLRKVQILYCRELLRIEALPACLEHLDLRGCLELTDIPSLMPMKSLVHLNLMESRKLRHIHGLELLTTLEVIHLDGCASIEDDGVNVNKDNKALRECDLRGSKVGVAYNNGWLEDEPSLQVIRYVADRLPSFLPNGRMAGCSTTDEYKSKVAEATISRKAECIVITCCATFTYRYRIKQPRMKLCVYRGGELAEESEFSRENLPFETGQRFTYCVTLRRKHRVVKAIQPGDRLLVFLEYNEFLPLPNSASEANVCVVYNGDGHLLLEVNSELLSKDASRELEKQFGELVLVDENQAKVKTKMKMKVNEREDENEDEICGESNRKRGVCSSLGFSFPTRRRKFGK